MSRLLAAAPSRIRSCLESQIGTIAGRNSLHDGVVRRTSTCRSTTGPTGSASSAT